MQHRPSSLEREKFVVKESHYTEEQEADLDDYILENSGAGFETRLQLAVRKALEVLDDPNVGRDEFKHQLKEKVRDVMREVDSEYTFRDRIVEEFNQKLSAIKVDGETGEISIEQSNTEIYQFPEKVNSDNSKDSDQTSQAA